MATYQPQQGYGRVPAESFAAESDAEFSPWTSAAPTDSEPEIIDESEAELEKEPLRRAGRFREASARGSSASRRKSPSEAAGSTPPSSFTRLSPADYQGVAQEMPSLLAASLQANPFGPAGGNPPDFAEATTSRSSPGARSMQLPSQPSSAARRRRGVRHTPPSSNVGLTARPMLDGVESEPDDPKLVKADDTFVELLEAAKTFLSLAPSSSSKSPPRQPLPERAASQDAEVQESCTPSIPTSYANSGVSSELGGDTVTVDRQPPERPKSRCLSGWLTSFIELRMWQTLALCSAAFGLGFSAASLYQPLRTRLR